MSNIDTKKFIKLMNKECDSNGHSPTFRAGENAIMQSQDPYFVYACIQRIRHLNVAKLSAHLASIPLVNYINNGPEYISSFIAIHKDMVTNDLADAKAHIQNLLNVVSPSKEEMADTMSTCLRIAGKRCPDLVPLIIKKLLNTERLSWQDFENCFKALVNKSIYEEDINRLKVQFIDNLYVNNIDMEKMKLIDALIAVGFLDAKKVANILLDSQSASPDVKYECFRRLAFNKNKIVEEDYTKLAKRLINEFKREEYQDTGFYCQQLQSYIEQYEKTFANEIVTAELQSLIKTMLENSVEEKAKLDPTEIQESNVSKKLDPTCTQEKTNILNNADLTDVQESNIKI